MWLDNAAKEIRQIKFPANFVPTETGPTAEVTRFYVVMPLPQEFRERYDAAWRRLTKVDSFRLNLHKSPEDEQPAEWDAKIVDYPGGVGALNAHLLEKYDLVLLVRRPLRTEKKRGPEFEVITFSDRPAANRALGEGKEQ